MTISERGTMPAPDPMRLVGIETYVRERPELGPDDCEWLMSLGAPRPGWPEDFRLPTFSRVQGCA